MVKVVEDRQFARATEATDIIAKRVPCRRSEHLVLLCFKYSRLLVVLLDFLLLIVVLRNPLAVFGRKLPSRNEFQ